MAELSVGEVRAIVSQASATSSGGLAVGGQYKNTNLVRNSLQPSITHIAEEIGIAFQGRLASAILERRSNKPANQQTQYIVPDTENAEELSMLVAGSKVTKKEEINTIDDEHRLHDNVGTAFDLQALLTAFVDLDEVKLEQFYQEVLDARALTGQGLKDLLMQRFTDPTMQYVAILFCFNKADAELKMLKEQPNISLQWLGKISKLRKLLISELRWYEDNYSQHIRASMNISQVVRDMLNKQRGLMSQDLHQFYKDAVLDYTHLRHLYGMILKRFGLDRFKTSVDFLLKSLIADFESQGPSIAKPKLKAIMDDIYQLHVLESIHLHCAELYGQLTRSQSELPYSIEFLLENVLAFQAGSQPGLTGVHRYLDTLLFMDRALQAKILLLNGTKKIIRLVPLKMYKERQTRDDQLQALQTQLDELASAEDESHYTGALQ